MATSFRQQATKSTVSHSDISNVKWGQNLEARPELRGRGQFLKVEAKAEAKNNYEKSTK